MAGATGVAPAPVGRAVSGTLPLALALATGTLPLGVDVDVESPLPRLGVTGADAVLLSSSSFHRGHIAAPPPPLC